MNDVDFSIVKDGLLDDPVLQVIPEMDRILIRMRAFGLSVEEIALVMGSDPEDVDAKLSEIEQNICQFKSFAS
jgi:hypothetical protein